MTAMIDIEQEYLAFRVHRLLVAESGNLMTCDDALGIADKIIALVIEAQAKYNAGDELVSFTTDLTEGGRKITFNNMRECEYHRVVDMLNDRDGKFVITRD